MGVAPGRFDTSGRSAEPTIESVMQTINGFVGMRNIKEELNKLISYGELMKELRRRKIASASKMSLHMVFKGPPGTGKTALAREFGKLFKAIGLLREGQVVEVDRSTIVGAVLGETEKIMRDAFERAKNGVLFIDEAYSLAGISAQGVSEDQNDKYGKDAVDTLLKLMEDNRSSVMVIVAGYPDPMDRFLRRNAGLRSRFTRTIEFKPYTHEELLQILRSFAEEWGYSLDDGALEEAQDFISDMPLKEHDFGNARAVRNFFEAILPVHADRVAAIPDFKTRSDEELLQITGADVQAATKVYKS